MKEAVLAMSSEYAESYMHCPIRRGACAGIGCMMWHKLINGEEDIGLCGFNDYRLGNVIVLRKVVDKPDETE